MSRSKRRWLFMALAFVCAYECSACGSDGLNLGPKEFTTRQGIPVYVDHAEPLEDKVTAETISDMVDLVWETPEFSGLAPKGIHIERGPIELGGGTAKGAYEGHGYLFLTSFEVCGLCVMGHEWGHYWLDTTTGDSDQAHTNSYVFGWGEGKLVYDAKARLEAYCAGRAQ